MKVAIVNRHREDALGGSEIQCDLIARAMLRRGHEVVYVAPDGRGSYQGVPYKVLPTPLTGKAIAQACLAQRPTIIYWRFNKKYLRQVARSMAAHKIPLVFATSHINDLLPWRLKPTSQETVLGSLRRIIQERWNYSGFKWVKGLICQTPEQAKVAPVSCSIVIPNSCVLGAIKPFSWPRPYVAWVSNIKTAKRPELCPALARQLLAREIDVVMVGRMVDSNYVWLQRDVLSPQNLYYLGPRSLEEVNGVLAGALALVHTCMPEGFPNVFIQAWLLGIPTVSLEFDPAGIIKTRGLGYVSGGDEQQFHNDVLQIVINPELARQAGNRARRYAREHCVPNRNVARLEAFLEEVIVARACRMCH